MRTLLCAAVLVLSAAAVGPPKEVTVYVYADDPRGIPVTSLDSSDFRLSEDGKDQSIVAFERYKRDRPAAIVLFLDLLNTWWAPGRHAIQQIQNAVARLDAPEAFQIYVLTYDGKLKVVQPSRLAEEFSGTGNIRPHYLQVPDTRAKIVFRALAWLTVRLARYPGRKALVWVGHGVPLSAELPSGGSESYDWFLERLAAAMAHAGVCGYSVAEATHAGAPDNYSQSAAMTLELFASLTGGRMYPAGYVEDALNHALTAARHGYRLTYRPAGPIPPNQLRKIRVACNRLEVRVWAPRFELK